MQPSTITSTLTWATRLLAVAAVALSCYLLYGSLTTEPVAGCGWSSFDCDSALASHWAKWFGAPVAAGGLLVYLAMLVGSFLIGAASPSVALAGWRLLEATVPLAAGAALWFLGVQLFALQSFCLYCLLTHSCGLIITVLVVLLRLTSGSDERPAPAIGAVGLGVATPEDPPNPGGAPSLGLPTACGVIALVVLITGQVFGPRAAAVQTTVEANKLLEVLSFDDVSDTAVGDEPSVSESPRGDASQTVSEREPKIVQAPKRREGGQRIVKLLNGSLSIDTYDNPVIGSPDAEHVVLELMDYACPHCRDFHELLDEALARYEGRVAVVVMPVPGEILCNPYVKVSRPKSRGACNIAKVSLASAMLSPEHFPEVHHWLLQGDRLPVYTTALIEAQRYADDRELSRALRDESGEIKARIDRHVKIMATLQQYGKFGLPTQIFPSRVITGPAPSVDELCELWANEFGVEKPVDTTPLPF